MIWFYTSPLWMPILMFIIFCGFALCKRQNWNKGVLFFEVIGVPLDILLNYTEFALLTWDRPKSSHTEGTFSLRLARLKKNTDWRGTISRPLVLLLNKILPGHIQ